MNVTFEREKIPGAGLFYMYVDERYAATLNKTVFGWKVIPATWFKLYLDFNYHVHVFLTLNECKNRLKECVTGK